MKHQDYIEKKSFGGFERYRLSTDCVEIYAKTISRETSYSIPYSRISIPPIISTFRNGLYLGLLYPSLVIFLVPLLLVLTDTHEKVSTQGCLLASAIGLCVIIASLMTYTLKKATAHIYLDKETGLIAMKIVIKKSTEQATGEFIKELEEKSANQRLHSIAGSARSE
jgi:hypothetical protein